MKSLFKTALIMGVLFAPFLSQSQTQTHNFDSDFSARKHLYKPTYTLTNSTNISPNYIPTSNTSLFKSISPQQHSLHILYILRQSVTGQKNVVPRTMAAYAKAQSTHRIFAGLNLVFEKNNIRIQAASKLAMAMGNQQLMWLFNGKPRFSISISVRFSC